MNHSDSQLKTNTYLHQAVLPYPRKLFHLYLLWCQKPFNNIETNEKRQAVITKVLEKVHQCILSSSLNYLPFTEIQLTISSLWAAQFFSLCERMTIDLLIRQVPLQDLIMIAICMLYLWSISDVPSFLF